jgi:hypothetical protein
LTPVDIYGSLHSRREKLQQILATLTGTPKRVLIGVGRMNENEQNTVTLQLEVMQCESLTSCRWKSLQKVNGIYITRDLVYDERYVIAPSSFLSIDQLDAFGRKVLVFSDGGHSGNMTPMLDTFLLHYCSQEHPSRLVSSLPHSISHS